MELIDRIQWLGQAAVKIETNGITIYIDPYLIRQKDKANYIYITHSHYDHLSPDDIKKVVTKNTRIFAPYDCVPKLIDWGYHHVTGIEPGYSEEFDNFRMEAVHAYNINKTTYHPRGNKWLGYILTIEGQRIYHAGDTERIPEMKDIRCDIALLPIGQTYTMNSVEEAAEAALDVKAKIAIPIHYGLYEGTKEDSLKFKELLSDKVEVLIK